MLRRYIMQMWVLSLNREAKMPAYLTTIREQIQELNPEEYRRMQATGELDQVLEEYGEQVKYARTAAARAARRRGDLDDPFEPAASMWRSPAVRHRARMRSRMSLATRVVTSMAPLRLAWRRSA